MDWLGYVLFALFFVLPVLGGLGMVWHEDRFYGPLAWRERLPLEAQNRMGVEGRDLFRDALRELRFALDHERAEDAAGWVEVARRRGWWIAELDAAADRDESLGKALRRVSARRADLEKRLVNIEGTRAVGTLAQAEKSAARLEEAQAAARRRLDALRPEDWSRLRADTRAPFAWAQGEIARIVELHARSPALQERLTALAEAAVSEDEIAAWHDWEVQLVAWGRQKTPHYLRMHAQRPPLPAYASPAARRQALDAPRLRAEHEAGTGLTARASSPSRPSPARITTAPPAAPAHPAPGAYPVTLGRRRAQARALHEEMTLQVAQYDLDFDLQLAYPQFHNRDIPEVRAMDGAARRARDEWDLVKDLPERRLTAEDVAAYRGAVDAFKQAVLAADARVRLIGDAGISDAELRDLETARGLFRHVADPANPPALRESYRVRLVQTLRRLNERTGGRVAFTTDGLLALEAGRGGVPED